MDTGKLKKFAQAARRELIQQVAGKLEQVLAEGSLARREQARTVADLEKQIQVLGRDEVIKRAAYTWFNRFTALRFMDAKGYNQIMAVSPAEGQSQPAILAEAKQGHIDEHVVPEKMRERVFALLDGRTPSRNAQGEAYRLLLVAVCNYWHLAMPFLFERIADWTELLMPDDLLSDGSVRTRIRTVLAAEDCQDVEVIGWLYQFYISEKKDEVFASLKKNKKITPENIPAATQLFTPHWIVRYLVESSLGRLWLQNRPQSKLAERMDYCIAPDEPETDFLRIAKPEDIRICDPACGSGHMLTYAFDLLHAIYEEEGYDPRDIPGLILKHNLHGIEIDDRAGALAAFALMMKAAERLGRRKFLRLKVQPSICVLQNVAFSQDELSDYMDEVGRDLFTAELRETLEQFEQAKNFGSLIQPALKDISEVGRLLATKDFKENLFLSGTHQRVLSVLRMAEILSPGYHVVVTNPPYMGGKGMNGKLSTWAKENYPKHHHDLMTCFMERSSVLSVQSAYWGMINLPSWMFLSSFDETRKVLVEKQTIDSLLHLGRGIFGSDFGSVAFVVSNRAPSAAHEGVYRRLFERHVDVRKPEVIRDLFFRESYGRFSLSQFEFSKLPGLIFAYWISQKERDLYASGELLSDVASPRKGIDTGENERFLRLWHEVSLSKSDLEGGKPGSHKWFPYNKGGEFRRWYGNRYFLLNWENGGREIRSRLSWKKRKPTIRNSGHFFEEGFTWTTVSSGGFSARYSPKGAIFDNGGCTLFANNDLDKFGAFLNSVVMDRYLEFLSPTLNFQPGDISAVLFPKHILSKAKSALPLVNLSKTDWDAYETSWDFTSLALLSRDDDNGTLEVAFARVRDHWREMTENMQRLEEVNNRVFIDAYGLQDELTPEVSMKEITLTCNPAYRYGGKLRNEEREVRLLADTMAEFLSYAVGCMFGRYSLDKPGLVLANQGETLADYLAELPEPSFLPDDDNVIPILDDTWFTDDIVERFHDFLRLTFGEEHFQENLAFIEAALGKPLRKYFVKDFYKDHVKRYKKRPIYWLFSSPKGSFNALIYMHRYRSDTVSVILNDYLREFRTKLAARVQQLEEIEASASSSASDKTAALKEISKLRATIAELEDWERKVLLPLASEKIEIDLDDGVKANYPKFGPALAKIPSLSPTGGKK